MSLKNKLKLGIAGLSLLVGLNTARAQSIEGYVNSSGEYPRPPIVNALVSAEELGNDYTDINGYYHIPPLAVIPPVQLHPQHGKQIRYGIFDILGRKVSDTKNLESVFNNLSSGFYVLRAEEENGVIQQKIIVNESNVFKGDKKYLFKFNNNVPVLNNIDNNSLKNNRSINSLYEFLVDDDNMPGIGEFYNYLDTLDIVNNETKDVRLIPHIELDSPYYDDILELMYHAENPMPPSVGNNTINNYRDYPINEFTPYPQRIWLNPEQAYQYCVDPELYLNTGPVFVDSINTKMAREGFTTPIFEVVDDSIDANIWLNYTESGGSHWSDNWQYINGEWYFAGGTIYLMNSFTNPQGLYAEYCHEGMRALGIEGYSLDPNHMIHVPVSVLDYSLTDIDLMKIHVLQYSGFITGPYYLDKFIEE